MFHNFPEHQNFEYNINVFGKLIRYVKKVELIELLKNNRTNPNSNYKT